MTQILKQSTAVDVLIGPFVDSTDGYTGEVGLSPAVKLSKNGQALAAKNDITTPVSDADGYYNCELDATDTNTVGTLVLSVVGSATSLPVRHEYQVVEEAVYDALYAASAAGPLQSTVAGRTLDVSAGGEAGIDWANVGSPTTAVDLSGTDIQLVDTVTTYTGNTVQTGDSYGRLGAPAGASVSADVAAVKVDTAAVLVDTADMQPKLGTPAADVSADIAAAKVDTAAILVDTGTTIPATLTDMQGATFSGATDSLEAIRDRGDAAWTTGAGGTPPQLLQSTTIATLASQTSFTLTAGSADDDAYNGAVAVITDQSTATQKAVGSVLDYTGATKTVTLTSDPGIFTMATGDTIDIIANASTAPTAAAVRAEIDTNSTQLALIVGDTNELQTNQGNWLTATGFSTSAALATAQTDLDTLTGTDGATLATSQANYAPATAASLATAQTDLDTLTGTDGATLATAQGNYAPATAAALATVDTEVGQIKTKTDSLTFSTANQVDANTLAINSATVVGDGNATPWDGA